MRSQVNKGWLRRLRRGGAGAGVALGISVVSALLVMSAMPAAARDRTMPPPRPTDVAPLKAYDVLERHCAGCHQSGMLQQRQKPAADFGHILRLDEVAADAHLVRPGNPDGSRLYSLMLGRRMPFDIYHEGASRDPPSADDMDAIRSWIARLDPKPRRSCGQRSLLSADAARIAIARDVEQLPADKRSSARYLSLAGAWNACASDGYLDTARQAALVLLAGLARDDRPVQTVALPPEQVLLRFDLDALQLPALVWDQLALLSPYSASSPNPDASAAEASPAALASGRAVPLDWLAFLFSEENAKRLDQASGLSPETRTFVRELVAGPATVRQLRTADPAAYAKSLARAGLAAAPIYDQIEMVDLLAHAYARDVGLTHAAADLGAEPDALIARLESGPPETRRLALHLAQGGVARSVFEQAYAAVAAHVLGRAGTLAGETIGVATLGRPPTRATQPFALEMIAEKPRYVRDEAASLIVRSGTDCHLTLVSVSPSGRAVVLLPNDWDRSTFLPAGKEQRFPREDSPFRLRLDVPGWETIIAGCHPSAPLFDGIQHDFNLEKFTSLGDYGRFLMRAADGLPMTSPATPLGERGAAPKRLSRAEARAAGKAEVDQSKPDPAARAAIRFEVRAP